VHARALRTLGTPTYFTLEVLQKLQRRLSGERPMRLLHCAACAAQTFQNYANPLNRFSSACRDSWSGLVGLSAHDDRFGDEANYFETEFPGEHVVEALVPSTFVGNQSTCGRLSWLSPGRTGELGAGDWRIAAEVTLVDVRAP